MHSVKTKIIALALCCVAVSSAAIGGASIINSRRVVDSDSAQIISLLCENRTNDLNDLFGRIEQSVTTLELYAERQLEDLDRFKTDGSYVEEYAQSLMDVAVNAAQNTEGALTVYLRFDPEFTPPQSGIFCGRDSASGRFRELVPTDLSLYDPSDTEHVGWFYQAAHGTEGVWLAPYYNDNLGVKMISYVVPMNIGGDFIGVVGMDIDFGILEDVVADTVVYHTGSVFLTDAQSAIVCHRSLPQGVDLKEYNNGEFRSLAELLIRSESNGADLIPYTFEGVKKEAAFRWLTNGMRLVLTVPVGEVDEQANALLVQIIAAVLFIVAAATVLTVIFTRRLVKPLLELTVAARKIAEGDLSVSITHRSEDEVGALAESFRQTVAHLHKYISYINGLAYRDSLTGVKNKAAYLESVQRLEEESRLRRPQYAVIVLDINGLKTVNDTRGHDFGDMLIIRASRLICDAFKRSPVYRIGGDEFVVLLEGLDYDRYEELLARFSDELEAYNRAPEYDLFISIARGIAFYTEESDLTYHDVFKRADNAMYHNKEEMKRQS